MPTLFRIFGVFLLFLKQSVCLIYGITKEIICAGEWSSFEKNNCWQNKIISHYNYMQYLIYKFTNYRECTDVTGFDTQNRSNTYLYLIAKIQMLRLRINAVTKYFFSALFYSRFSVNEIFIRWNSLLQTYSIIACIHTSI